MDDFPKRRKHKDNPYTIRTIDNRYYILFVKVNIKMLEKLKIKM